MQFREVGWREGEEERMGGEQQGITYIGHPEM